MQTAKTINDQMAVHSNLVDMSMKQKIKEK